MASFGEMNMPLSKLSIESLPYIKYISFSLFTNLLVGISVLVLANYLPTEVPLFFGLPQSEGQLGQKLYLLIPPAISIFIIFINTVIIRVLKDNFLQRIMVGLTIATTILSTIAIIKIILLVGSF